ncbi:MAG: hypothetical protein ACQXXH_02880 [Candidatus Bathyarchaeia archaeon]|nr:hypothetical protein [Candidatus Bathyarchaeota archaeon A05DMB-4]MDH7594688.1 hypothetical protein [Candidatus Bathyarchaeota archaeon]
MAAQKVIYFIIFFLFLVGACGLSAYAFSVAIDNELSNPLFYASTAITWGVILLILYLVFERQDWEWWS